MEYILSFLSKISPGPYPELQHEGEKVEVQLQRLRSRSLDLESTQYKSLARLLQHIDISIFTKAELEAVGKLRLDLLSGYSNERVEPIIQPEMGLYDTGSYHIYRRLIALGLDPLQVQNMRSRITQIRGQLMGDIMGIILNLIEEDTNA